MEETYEKEICINCANENCTKRIETIKKLELLDKEMKTVTTVKCKDFICKNKRNKQPLNWRSEYDRL